MPARFFASTGTISSILGVLREVDVRPIRAAADSHFVLVVTSHDLPLAQHLVDCLYQGPRAQDIPLVQTTAAVPLESSSAVGRANMVVIVTREDRDNHAELELLRQLEQTATPALVCLLTDPAVPASPRQRWFPAATVALNAPGGTLDDRMAVRQLVAGVRALHVVDDLALARHLPAFRESISRGFIEDTAIANGIYSFGSGIVEINPVADVPLNVADMIILTKNQALMAYKIALSMGMSAEFRQVMPQLAAVVGGGFLLRQTARGLVGLVPGFGIIPKVAVAFAGTVATGEMIYRWCAAGERLTGSALKQTYDTAWARGKALARSLFRRGAASRQHQAETGVLDTTQHPEDATG